MSVPQMWQYISGPCTSQSDSTKAEKKSRNWHRLVDLPNTPHLTSESDFTQKLYMGDKNATLINSHR